MLRGGAGSRFVWALTVVACCSSLVDCKGREEQQQQQSLDPLASGRTPPLAAPVKRPQREHQQGRESRPSNNGAASDNSDDIGHLESMEDLEHLAYLTMRNFNITDEGLLAQSSWLMNFGNAANHKQHQAAAISDHKTRLALMLESFILHLRNGHLRRLQLEELEAIVATLNSTAASSDGSDSSPRAPSVDTERRQPPNSRDRPADRDGSSDDDQDHSVGPGRQRVQVSTPKDSRTASEVGDNKASAVGPEASGSAQREPPAAEQTADSRCQFLVTIYKFELKERRKNFEQQQQQQQQQSKIEFESGQQSQAQPQSQQQQQLGRQPSRRSSTRELVQPSGESGREAKRAAAFSDLASSGQEPSEAADANSGGGGDDDDDDNDHGDNRAEGAAGGGARGGPDSARLMRLCQMAVKCHSADELVNLISGPWRPPPVAGASFGKPSAGGGAKAAVASGTHDRARRIKRWLASMLTATAAEGAEAARGDAGGAGLGRQPPGDSSGSSNQEAAAKAERTRPRNLRDSLSLSLAKLCPLMLFQLHDDDGICSVRRDDRPSMITVWGFATLFVTIVSFCSLIGLSITPLLGPTATESSTTGSSDTGDSSPGAETRRFHHGQPHGHLHHHHRQHHHLRQAASMVNDPAAEANAGGPTPTGSSVRDHRTCLTLFEGLAVGSLVGSALFSLIPQAFELQERESNQGFLLKALIIFFGIYLFFCSERIMRIILDTRQQRKKKKRITNHRSSNSMALPSTTVDFDHHHHHHQHHPNHAHQHYHHNHHSNTTSLAPQQPSSRQANGGRKNLAANQLSFRFNGGSTPKLNLRDQHSKAIGSGRPVHTPPPPATAAAPPRLPESSVKSPAGGHVHQREQPLARIASSDVKSLGSATGGAGATTAATPVGSTRNRTRRRKTRHQLQAAKRQQRKRHHLNQPLVLHHHHHHHHPSQHQHQPLPPLQRDSSDDDDLHGSLAAGGASSSSALSLVSLQGRELPRNARGSLNQHQNPDDSLAGESCAYMSASNDEINFSDDDDKYQQMRAVNQHLFSGRRHNQEAECLSFLQQQQQQKQRTSFYLGGHSDPEDAINQQYQYQQQQQYHLQRQHQQMSDTNANHHVSDNKQDISTVAWMIVLGDGLHNFIDGISIGAAFSESILSGVSISVAVICEEFPHELGDFAVLVSSGMTVRQALGYNFLSACTCYFGMAVGIILGDVNDGASYISALAAGVFLYIALVDMMGELSATLEETSRDSIAKTLKLLLLQNIGIFIGISIIFILSFIDF